MSIKFEELKNPLIDAIHKTSKRPHSKEIARFFPSGSVMPLCFKECAEDIKNFEVREDDIWVLSYPKCGTTWTQEMVWLLANNLDYDGAAKSKVTDRSLFLEYGVVIASRGENYATVGDTIAMLNSRPSPRVIKSHLHKELLPDQLWTKKPKIVYVARNAKDVVVSYCNHYRLMTGYTGSTELFAEAFMAENALTWDPFWKHVLDFWKMRDEPNILFNSYEEMKKDLPGTIKKTAQFLGEQYTEEQFITLAKHLDFGNMKYNPMVNYGEIVKRLNEKFSQQMEFIRKGEIGSGNKELSPDVSARLDKWSRERIQGTDYPYVG